MSCDAGAARLRQRDRRRVAAIPVAAGLGAHQPNRRLPLAQQRQGRRGQVQAVTTAATGLACFIFRFLRRPQIQKARVQSKNISHFAFTATPKHSTKMLFGRTKNGEPASDDNLPESFHLYPQRQAIEEGFILDVLQGYVPYKQLLNSAVKLLTMINESILKQPRKP